jgi:hypothetical protein
MDLQRIEQDFREKVSDKVRLPSEGIEQQTLEGIEQ